MAQTSGNETALYDDPEFFAAYEEMRALAGTLNDVVETPALVSLLPSLQGIAAADLGCGMCRWLVGQGAAYVIGFDASEKMLDGARQQGLDTESLRFLQVDLDQLDLGEQKFDLVVSGLALHYVADFARLAGRVAQALRPGGCFVFSVEHPVITCGDRAWACREDGSQAHWPVDHYSDEGPRAVNWLGFEDVPRYHRTVSGYVEPLLAAGLTIKRLLEPAPSQEDIETWPRLADHRRRPAFLVVTADKPVV
jgi:SAM-dependent methyltransferase